MDLPALTIMQRATAINKAINEVRKIRPENQVADELTTRNKPFMDHVHDLPLNSDIPVWPEDNTRQGGK